MFAPKAIARQPRRHEMGRIGEQSLIGCWVPARNWEEIGTRASVTRGGQRQAPGPPNQWRRGRRRQRERPGGQDLRLGQGESVLRNPLDGLNIVLLDEVPHRVWRESIDPLGFGAQPGSTHPEVGA